MKRRRNTGRKRETERDRQAERDRQTEKERNNKTDRETEEKYHKLRKKRLGFFYTMSSLILTGAVTECPYSNCPSKAQDPYQQPGSVTGSGYG